MSLRGRVAATMSRGLMQATTFRARRAGDPVALLLAPRRGGADDYGLYEQVREKGSLTPSVFGIWATADHSVCGEALRCGELGSAPAQRLAAAGPAHPLMPPSMIAVNPPQHTRQRRLVSQAFSPRVIEALRPRVEAISAELLEAASGGGGFDLVRDYAGVLPVAVIAELLGVSSDDRTDFRNWGNAVAKTLDTTLAYDEVAAAQAGLVALNDYFAREVSLRVEQPREDVLSALMQPGRDGERLDEREVMATALLLLVAGFETTVNLIGNAVHLLLPEPSWWTSVATDADFRADAVEEVLRFEPPVQYTTRQALEPLELAGQALPRGATVMVLLAGAGRDPRVFENPARFDPTRGNARDHLAFASGVHFCLGAALARLEADVALRHLAERWPSLRPAGAAVRRSSRLLRGFDRMPLNCEA